MLLQLFLPWSPILARTFLFTFAQPSTFVLTAVCLVLPFEPRSRRSAELDSVASPSVCASGGVGSCRGYVPALNVRSRILQLNELKQIVLVY